MTQTRTWFDHRGNAFEAPADAETCTSRLDGTVHYLFAAQDPFMLSPQTLCGRRAGHIPGDGEVTCRECLDLRAQP